MSRPTSLLLVGLCFVIPLWGDARGEPMTLVSTEPPPLECPRVKKVFVVGRGNTLCRPVSSVWSVFHLPEGVMAAIPKDPPPPGYTIVHKAGSGYVSIIVTDAAIAQEASFKIEQPHEFIATVIVRPMSLSSQSLGEYVVEHITHEQANDIAEAQAVAAARAEAKARAEAERLEKALAQAQKKALSLSQQKEALVAKLARVRTSAHVRGFRKSKRIRELDAALRAATATIERLRQKTEKAKKALAAAEEKRKGDIARVIKEAERRAREVEARESMKRMKTNKSKRTRFIAHRKADSQESSNPWKLDVLGAEWDSTGERFLVNTAVVTLDGKAFCATEAQVLTEDGAQLPNELFGTDERAEENKPGHWTLSVDFSSQHHRPESIHEIELRDAHNRTVSFVVASWTKQTYSIVRKAETARDRWLREEREKAHRERLGKQSILSPRFVGGAFWLSDGMNTDEVKPAGFVAVGARFTKGFIEQFGLEIESVVGQTGDVDFDASGVTRSATFGRLQFGAVARWLSGNAVPTFRLGAGLQGANYHVQGGDSSFELDLLFTFGAGIDYRYGENFVVGAALASYGTISGTGQEEPVIVEGGVHIAYCAFCEKGPVFTTREI